MDHHQPDHAPGFDAAPDESWAQGLRYYYAAAPVELPVPRKDGSFSNSSNPVNEDDPLIATAFAIRVLLSP